MKIIYLFFLSNFFSMFSMEDTEPKSPITDRSTPKVQQYRQMTPELRRNMLALRFLGKNHFSADDINSSKEVFKSRAPNGMVLEKSDVSLKKDD
ncbi:hypothetical protein M1446_02480 [Candidatus Dependentiae bacterium]|nr:hypothetical protein [Candidatus Dependentiae bacterium]